MSDTTMIQNRTEEYSNVRKSKTKNIPQQSQKWKLPSPCWLWDDLHFTRNCPFRYYLCNIYRKSQNEARCKSGDKASSKNKEAAKKARPAKSLSIVSSTYGTNEINRHPFATLTINSQKVRMQLDTASDIILISRKNKPRKENRLRQSLTWQKELKRKIHSEEIARKFSLELLSKLRSKRSSFGPTNTKRDRKKAIVKMTASHRTQMEEKDIRSILGNLSGTSSRTRWNTSRVSERLCHLKRHKLRSMEMVCTTGSRRITWRIQQPKGRFC